MTSIAVCYDQFQKLGCEVLVINVDSVLDHKVWQEVELEKMAGCKIPFPMLFDKNGSIGKLYDIFDQKTGKDVWGTFIIDHECLIHASEVLTSAVGRNPDEIIRLIKAYQRHVATKEAIPCSWTEGKKTIVPSIDKAGKVWQEWTPTLQ